MVYSLVVPSLLKVGFHILLLFLFSFHVDRAMSSNNYVDKICDFNVKYTGGGAFEANMRSVFSTLIKDAPPVLFANATAGEGSERVYGLVQCRGDVDPDTCYTCISNSTEQIVDRYCPYATDAIIWYEKCQLRYSDDDFIGILNVEDLGDEHSSNDNVQRPEAFIETLDSLLKQLTYQATTEPSSRLMFATGNIPYENQQTIYGLVQCTKDTSLANCSWCLNNITNQIRDTCSEKGALAHGCEIVTGSCRVRFDTELFYTATTTPSPSPSLSSSTGSSNKDKVNHSSVISVTMITVITFALTSTYLF